MPQTSRTSIRSGVAHRGRSSAWRLVWNRPVSVLPSQRAYAHFPQWRNQSHSCRWARSALGSPLLPARRCRRRIGPARIQLLKGARGAELRRSQPRRRRSKRRRLATPSGPAAQKAAAATESVPRIRRPFDCCATGADGHDLCSGGDDTRSARIKSGSAVTIAPATTTPGGERRDSPY